MPKHIELVWRQPKRTASLYWTGSRIQICPCKVRPPGRRGIRFRGFLVYFLLFLFTIFNSGLLLGHSWPAQHLAELVCLHRRLDPVAPGGRTLRFAEPSKPPEATPNNSVYTGRWRHRIYGHDTIATFGYNSAKCSEIRGKDLSH